MNWFQQAFEAQLTIAGHAITYREIIGNLFGLASAIGGMRRKVWAWPVGIVGNVLLFTVFLGVAFGNPQGATLYGQAGRQIFFILASVYGWWRWQRTKNAAGGHRPRRPPAVGDRRRARLVPVGLGRPGRRLLRDLQERRRRLPRALVVLPRRLLDLRRLDARDVRHGPRLGGLLAVLDRRRPGRRPGTAALPVLPVGRHVRRLRRLRHLGLLRLAPDLPRGADRRPLRPRDRSRGLITAAPWPPRPRRLPWRA